MRRFLLISLSLVLGLVGWSAVCADDGFYVIGGGGKSASVPKTGQTTSYDKRDDGALQKGVAWPTARFTDNLNGTVTDNLTKLIWMKNAGAIGQQTWTNALGIANGMESGDFGLTDGSVPGDWRLPNIRELESLLDCGGYDPALPAVNPFTIVHSDYYWSSSTYAYNTSLAWNVHFLDGIVFHHEKGYGHYVWCVRGGP